MAIIRALAATLAMLAVVTPAAAQTERRVALVIGNSDYARTADLRNPAADAGLMARTLQQAGFGAVTADLDLGVNAFRTKLQAFRQLADTADVAVVYYAGHGIEVDGETWLLPVDADIVDARDLPDIAINLTRLLDAVQSAPLRIVIVDACRNNPFRGSIRIREGERTRSVGERGLTPINRSGMMILYAAAPGNVASDGAGENSPFALALAQYLPQPGLDIHRLPSLIRDRTLELTNGSQEPYLASSIPATFEYFVPPLAPTGAVTTSGAVLDLETETRLFQAARAIAASTGDCAALAQHRDSLRSGETREAADAEYDVCRQNAENGRPESASFVARPGDPADLDLLVTQNREPLARADFEALAAELGVEWETLAAVAEVESGPLGGFAADGRPVILFERHIFSRRTNGRYDASHPAISAPTPGGYPRTQSDRWRQLREAYALDAEAALASASYGRFQILAQNHSAMGYLSPSALVQAMASSEREQLRALGRFVRGNNLVDELQRKDWMAFAARYNSQGLAERYGQLLAQAYARLKANPIA